MVWGTIAFGDVRRDGSSDPTGEIEPLHIHRGLPVRFNGERGVEGQNLAVFVGDTLYSQSLDDTAPSSDTYYLKPSNFNYFTSPITASDETGKLIDFTSQDPTGVSFTSLVKAVHIDNDFIGTNASATSGSYDVGTWVPAYGFWEFCDYFEGSFPRTVSLIQGRLVFGGTPKQPLKVAVSEVFDSLEPGENFRNFQTLLSDSGADEAFQFSLQAQLNDKITAIEEFNNSLFIFTKNATYRLVSGEGGLTPTSYSVQFQVGLGCVNSRCVERIENTMYFMNKTGVYDIAGTDDASQYASAERSLKIRDYFDENQFEEENAWMKYDPTDSELYVAVSSNKTEKDETDNTWTAERLLVYNVFRNSWAEYVDYTGRFFTLAGTIILKRNNESVPLFYSTLWEGDEDENGSPTKILLSTLEEFRPVDYVGFTSTSSQSSGWTNTITNVPARQLTYTLSEGRYFYPVDRNNESVGKNQIFSLMPHREVEDVKVELSYDGGSTFTRLTFNDDFVKFKNGTFENGIYLTSVVPDSNKEIRITKLSQPEDDGWTGDIHPVRAWLDNKLLVENEDYTVDFTNDGLYELTFNFDVNANAVLETGVTSVLNSSGVTWLTSKDSYTGTATSTTSLTTKLGM